MKLKSLRAGNLMAASLVALQVIVFAGPVRANNNDDPASNASSASTNGPAVTATEVLADQNQQPMLRPDGDALLQASLQKYVDIQSRGGFPKISGAYKKGSTGSGVAALNNRLYVEGYVRVEATQGNFAQIFTTATLDAVMRFQRNHGLAQTGRTDAATLAELNVPVEQRIATIRANIPRLAVYEQGLGDRYVVVNVPAQQLETVQNNRVFSRHNTIVGRPERPSPVVMTPLSLVRFNPYWNAPASIVEKDIIPKMSSGTQILNDMNIKVFQGGANGPEINPATVNWSKAVVDDYLFRQEPGPKNAMATAKIEFNSPFGIYLHDTPEPQLFKTSNRFYSSGCIRVEKMPVLVQWVLNGQDGYDAGKIASMAQTLERVDEPIAAPPQLRVAYLTAWPASGGTVAFRRDVYNMDASGFTVGQPMPVGQMSPDGQRFVLKPLPRQIPVDAAEAESTSFFGLFTRKSGVQNAAMIAPSTGKKPSIIGKPSPLIKSASAVRPQFFDKNDPMANFASPIDEPSLGKKTVSPLSKVAKTGKKAKKPLLTVEEIAIASAKKMAPKPAAIKKQVAKVTPQTGIKKPDVVASASPLKPVQTAKPKPLIKVKTGPIVAKPAAAAAPEKPKT